jgi:hypothetical protein
MDEWAKLHEDITIFYMTRTGCYGLLIANILLISSCSIQKQIGKEAKLDILSNADFAPAHVGISLYVLQHSNTCTITRAIKCLYRPAI